MNARERGFLLLSSHLGDPDRRPLTTAQLRVLADRVQTGQIAPEDRELEAADLTGLGYGRAAAEHILELLAQEDVLEHYLRRGREAGCVPITRVSSGYPLLLRRRLGTDSPGVLWAKGELSLLEAPGVGLVGSRELREENRCFAHEVGTQAARQGYVLVSGNARGADQTAQNACLQAGGRVISVVADRLLDHVPRDGMLYLSEDGYAEEFTAPRALSRNRCIHALGVKTFVAQSACQSGGTWDGTVKNLRWGWSSVFCFDDGSEGIRQLGEMGATLIGRAALTDFYALPDRQPSLFDR